MCILPLCIFRLLHRLVKGKFIIYRIHRKFQVAIYRTNMEKKFSADIYFKLMWNWAFYGNYQFTFKSIYKLASIEFCPKYNLLK